MSPIRNFISPDFRLLWVGALLAGARVGSLVAVWARAVRDAELDIRAVHKTDLGRLRRPDGPCRDEP